MKRMVSCIGFTALALALVASTAVALSLCDYRSPKTAITDMGLSFAYRYFDDGTTPDVDAHSGRIGMDFNQLFDSPNIGFSAVASAEIGLEEFMPTGWLGQGSGTFRYYFSEDMPFFAFGGAEGAASPSLLGLEIRAGAGLGRFTDVTPLAKALTIEDELMSSNAIGGELSDETLMTIAEIIGRRIEFEEFKDLVADVEAAIEAEAGIELDARALLTIEEVILVTGDKRKCGWAVQAGIGYELIDPYGGDRDIVIAASADAAFATGPADQLVFHASFSGPFDILNENTLTATLSYERELSEDSVLLAGYKLHRVKPAAGVASANHAASLAVGFDIGGADVGLQAALTKDAGDPAWSVDISISAALDLL